MSSSYEKSVKGGTKIKLAAPKAKYVEHILRATRTGEAGVGEILRTLQFRLRDSTWTIVFKALIIIHLMVREGEANVTLRYLADSPSKLDVGSFSEGNRVDALLTKHGYAVQQQGANIRHYATYLSQRVKGYKDTKVDWVREGQGRLKNQTIDKGLLRETETVQSQIRALLQCDFLNDEQENEITLMAFRLITMDLLVLFHVMNEGTINILEHYFEMSKVDAQRAFDIYKVFSRQTNQVVEFLGVAKQYENATRLEIPKLKHAPTSLAESLGEYLSDPDFEINRRQYLAAQEAKRTGRPMPSNTTKELPKPSATDPQGPLPGQRAPPTQQAAASPPKGPAPDLIDFFESIEQNQQPLGGSTQQAPQFAQTQQYPYQQVDTTGQQAFANQTFSQAFPQTNGAFPNSNPYGQLPPQQHSQQGFMGSAFDQFAPQSQQPFPSGQTDFSQQLQQQQQQAFPTGQSDFSQPQQNGFAQQPAQAPQPFMPRTQTGSTNPFRQSMMPVSPISPPVTSPFGSLSRQSTNPFARSTPQVTPQAQDSFHPQLTNNSPFTSPLPAQSTDASSLFPSQAPPQSFPAAPPAPQQGPAQTGTNPFARTVSPPNSASAPSPLLVQATGSTNPFRKSTMAADPNAWSQQIQNRTEGNPWG